MAESGSGKWNEDGGWESGSESGNENESYGWRWKEDDHFCYGEGDFGKRYESDHDEEMAVGAHVGPVAFGNERNGHLKGCECGNDGEVDYGSEYGSESGNDAVKDVV